MHHRWHDDMMTWWHAMSSGFDVQSFLKSMFAYTMKIATMFIYKAYMPNRSKEVGFWLVQSSDVCESALKKIV